MVLSNSEVNKMSVMVGVILAALGVGLIIGLAIYFLIIRKK